MSEETKKVKLTYYESFKIHWISIYKKQVEKAKLCNDDKALSKIRNNIRNNIHLSDKEKENIFRLIGILPKKKGDN